MLARIYDEKVTEDDLDNLSEEVLEISERLGRVPDQVIVVSKAGFSHRAFAWASNESNWISFKPEDENARSTPVELIQETPAGTFKIVA